MNSQAGISVGHEDLRISGDLDISTKPGGPPQIKNRAVTNVLTSGLAWTTSNDDWAPDRDCAGQFLTVWP